MHKKKITKLSNISTGTIFSKSVSAVLFMWGKVFVHLANLKLNQISQTYIKNIGLVRTFDKDTPRILLKLLKDVNSTI